MPLYFSRNTFAFDNLDLFAHFADIKRSYDNHMGKLTAEGQLSIEKNRLSNIKTITSLDIKWHGEAPARAAKELLKFEGLRNLTIHIVTASVARVTKTKPYEMTLFGMPHLLELRGLKELQLDFPERLSCRRMDSPEEVKNGQWNLAEGESREGLERKLEVLKQEKKAAKQDKVGGQKAKKVGAVAEKLDQKA